MKSKGIIQKISFITLLFLFTFGILLTANSVQAKSVYTQTEFNYQPRKMIPFFFGSLNFRGRDYMSGGEIGKTLGGGAGLFYNINIDPMWRGHKFLYSYLDLEFQQEWNSARLEENPGAILVISPGIMVRTFIPFIKIFYGTGLSLRIGNSDFEKWGIFGQFGLEYRGIFLSARMVGSPGEGSVYNELRAGYMFVPSKKSWRR